MKQELPKQYKNWVHFYDSIKNFEKEGMECVFIPIEPETNVLIHNEIADTTKTPFTEIYYIQDIKTNALNEIMSERLNEVNVDDIMKVLQKDLNVDDFYYYSKLHLYRRLKRILTTQIER